MYNWHSFEKKYRMTNLSCSNYRNRPSYRRSMSLSPSRIDEFKYRETIQPVRTMIRESFREDTSGGRGLNGHHIQPGHHGGHGGHHNSEHHHQSVNPRLVRRSPSVAKERTRDELIDSIVHTRTREHRVMPGFHSASDWEERKAMGIDCDKVYYKKKQHTQKCHFPHCGHLSY